MSRSTLPEELEETSQTVEYKLGKKEADWPAFIFLIDTAIEEEELNELKDSIQQVLSNLPQECSIGIITFGNMCNVHEIGFSEFPICHTFKGEKHYKVIEIQEQLGLINKRMGGNSNMVNNNRNQIITNTGNANKFIVPLSECEFSVNTFLDDLQPDPWSNNRKKGERFGRCSGLALNVAISLLEAYQSTSPSRIMLFLGGAPSIGQGQIVGRSLVETIRNYVDFEKGNTNTKYYKPACEFYEQLSKRAIASGQIIDIFSCSLNQVGLYETRVCSEKTGGYMILTDSFSTMQFKDSFKKIFDLDEYNNLKMNFRAKIEVNTTNPIRLSGALGHLASLQMNGNNVSDIKIGEAGTKSWYLGGIDSNSTYTFLLDMNNTNTNTNIPKMGYIQILTNYISGDRSHRLRVTTVCRKIIPDLNIPNYLRDISNSFDQEAACTLMARICVLKGYTEESRDVLKWLDKSLIRLMSKFSNYERDNTKSFKLPPPFFYFPQFMFYLRRSQFISNFNASPDEVTNYKYNLMHETVTNCGIMIQPMLFAYSAENPEAAPVYLDLDSMKNDHVLCLDAFFFVVVWHGSDVCGWRDSNLQDDPEYENIRMMLDNPQEYAQGLIMERMPVPRFVSCDSGTGPERLVKCTVNPSSGSKNKVAEDGFFSDDVSLKVFMEFLVKLAVSG